MKKGSIRWDGKVRAEKRRQRKGEVRKGRKGGITQTEKGGWGRVEIKRKKGGKERDSRGACRRKRGGQGRSAGQGSRVGGRLGGVVLMRKRLERSGGNTQCV